MWSSSGRLVGLWRSFSAVDLPTVDRRHRTDDLDGPAAEAAAAAAASPRPSIPSWYRGLHQSIRALSHSGLNLSQLDEDDDDDDTGQILATAGTRRQPLLSTY